MNPAPKSIGRRPPAAVPTERSGRRSSVIKFTPGAPSYVQRAPDQLVTEEGAPGVNLITLLRLQVHPGRPLIRPARPRPARDRSRTRAGLGRAGRMRGRPG